MRVTGMHAGCLCVSIRPVQELFLVLSIELKPLFFRDWNKDLLFMTWFAHRTIITIGNVYPVLIVCQAQRR